MGQKLEQNFAGFKDPIVDWYASLQGGAVVVRVTREAREFLRKIHNLRTVKTT